MANAVKVLTDTILPTYICRKTISATQAQGLFGASLDFTLPMPGFVQLPKLVHVRKAAGAYGIAAVTAFQILSGTLADNIPLFAITVSGFFDAAGAMTSTGIATGNGLAASFGLLPNLDLIAGKALSLCTKGAALTGAGGELDITILYTVIPLTYSMI